MALTQRWVFTGKRSRLEGASFFFLFLGFATRKKKQKIQRQSVSWGDNRGNVKLCLPIMHTWICLVQTIITIFQNDCQWDLFFTIRKQSSESFCWEAKVISEFLKKKEKRKLAIYSFYLKMYCQKKVITLLLKHVNAAPLLFIVRLLTTCKQDEGRHISSSSKLRPSFLQESCKQGVKNLPF